MVIRIALITMILLSIPGCVLYRGDDGITFFKPDYMNRSRPVQEEDIKILDNAISRLGNSDQWNRKDDRFCFCGEKWSLFCALAKASIEVTGEYDHRRVAMQEVRFAINDKFRDRWEKHQLMDFNNHVDTTFEDLRAVLLETKSRLESRYKN